MHDTNNAEYEGTRRGAQEFCEAEGVGFVPISDAFRTAILAKQGWTHERELTGPGVAPRLGDTSIGRALH